MLSSKRGRPETDLAQMIFTRRRIDDPDTPALLSEADLATLLDCPTVMVPNLCSERSVEDELVEEHAAVSSLALEFNLSDGLNDVSNGDQESPPVQMPSMPAFGLGLIRQRSFAPACFLTEEEAEVQSDMRSRCAAAITRLVRRNERHRTPCAISSSNSSTG